MADQKNTPLLFRLLNSSIDQFAVFENNNCDNSNDFDFHSKINFSLDSSTLILSCATSVEISKKDKLVAVGAITFRFRLNEESVKNNLTDGNFCISKDNLIYFASKTYGALRGVMIAKLEPTSIRTILPFADLSAIITGPFVIKMQ